MAGIEKKKAGFAAMSPEKRAEISRKGGIAAHRAGTAHEWDGTTARAAGSKGGAATHNRARRQQGEGT
jgi:uncharacterized protein